MSIAEVPTHTGSRQASATTSQRLTAAAAALLGAALFMTVAVVNVPHDATDAELLTWWQQSANRMTGVWSGLFALAVAVLLPVVVHQVLSVTATSKAPQWTAFARSMAAATTAVWLVTGAARAAIGRLVDVMGEPLPGIDVLRFATALNYSLLGLSGMGVLGACIFAVSVVALKTGALARWVGYLGLVCALVILAAVLAQFGGFAVPVAILWSFGIAAALWRQPAPVPTGAT